MATGKRYYWIKLKDTFMTSDSVDFLMSQPNGSNYVVLYQMLCLKTINTDGRLTRQIGEVIIPYDIDKIQRDCKWFSTDTIRVALNLYQKLGLIYQDTDGTLVMADHNNLVGSETDWKDQKRKQREKLNSSGECQKLTSDMLLLPTGEKQFIDEKRYGGNGMLAFQLANCVCEKCGADNNLLIHHGNGYSNDIEDLYVLCKTCHGIAHAKDTPKEWLTHNRCGQECGHVHIDIRDKRLDIRDKILDNKIIEYKSIKERLTDSEINELTKMTYHNIPILLKTIDSRVNPNDIEHPFEYVKKIIQEESI